MDDHFDIGRLFEIGKFDITRLTCICGIYRLAVILMTSSFCSDAKTIWATC